MDDVLHDADLFQGLSEDERQRAAALAEPAELSAGQYLFLLGDVADRLYVVTDGKMDLCFPMAFDDVVRDISVESVRAGQTLGWSALVKPYRFTLTARASGPCRVMGFSRTDLLKFFESNPRIGYLVLTRISELVGFRLLTVQALWVRSLQRILESEKPQESS